MPYFAVDDGLYDHPKFDGLSDTALALWTRSGSWCMRYLTDGFVPSDRVRKLGYDTAHADELVRRGLWVGVQDGFRFHEWLKHQESKADIEKHRDRWREEKRAKRRAKSQTKSEMSASDSGAESGKESACPNPTQPNPIKERGADASTPRRKRPENRALDALKAALRSHYAMPPALSKSLGDKVGGRLKDAVAAKLAPDLASAADALVRAHKASPKAGNIWALCDVHFAAQSSNQNLTSIDEKGNTKHVW